MVEWTFELMRLSLRLKCSIRTVQELAAVDFTLLEFTSAKLLLILCFVIDVMILLKIKHTSGQSDAWLTAKRLLFLLPPSQPSEQLPLLPSFHSSFQVRRLLALPWTINEAKKGGKDEYLPPMSV